MKAHQLVLVLMIQMMAVCIACSDVNTTLPFAPTPPPRSTGHTTLAPVLSTQISPPVESMRMGETLSFWVKVELGEGVPPSAGPFPQWSSTNPAVITIDHNGNATAIGKGAATIEVIFMGRKAIRTIHVT